jgi:hypothetical protein
MDLLIGSLILTAIALMLTYFLYSNNDGDSSIPYAKYGSYPIIGHFFFFMRDRTKLLIECGQRYGQCFRIKVFNQRFTMILSYADWITVVKNSSLKFMGIEFGMSIFGLSSVFLGKCGSLKS